jgi:hypothetical protein
MYGPVSSLHLCPCLYTSSLVVYLTQSLALVNAAYREPFSLPLANKLSLSEFSLVIPLKWKQYIIQNSDRTDHFARCHKADRAQDDSLQST